MNKETQFWKEIEREELLEEMERLDHELRSPEDFEDCSTFARKTMRDPFYAYKFLEKSAGILEDDYEH
jgi:hypothetical protein